LKEDGGSTFLHALGVAAAKCFTRSRLWLYSDVDEFIARHGSEPPHTEHTWSIR